jgi:hypothetical protein
MSSCHKNHLYVQNEWIDKKYLASSHVGTPDPRNKSFVSGNKLIISWAFPKNLYKKNLSLLLTMRFFGNTQDVITHLISKKKSYTTFFFPKNKKILTYQIQIVAEDGQIIEVWKHQLWTELIDIDKQE